MSAIQSKDRAKDREPPWLAVLTRAAEWMAYLAGLTMMALLAVCVVSILGRALFSKPVLGDFELVERVTAICVAWSLPYCQIVGGHVLVDIFTDGASRGVKAILDASGAAILAVVAGLLFWRTLEGVRDLHEYGETSMILGVPTWIPVGLMLPGLAMFAVCCLSTCVMRLKERGT
jgi:TRAP-type C4-dicarboxylate transport system permease small subunit